MLRYFMIALIALVLIACDSRSEKLNREPAKHTESAKSKGALQISETIGMYEGINDDGDYSLLLLRKENGNIESFVFTADSVLANSDIYKGKNIRVKWEHDKLENAGSSETFAAKVLIQIDIVE